MPPQYGYGGGYYKPLTPRSQTSPLALAASGSATSSNPFGFQTAKNTTGYQGGSVAPVPAAPVPHPVKSAATTPIVTPIQRPVVAPPSPAAAGLPQYDINTDPALQGVNALTGESDAQAQADALKQKSNILLGYGSADLAKAAIGDPNVAAAAAGNPSSTLAQLGQQHGRNEHALTENLNANNLLYSGYRVTQEQQAEQDYQNALAKAAGEVQGGLGSVDSNLAAALGSNRAQRVAALNEAAARAMQAALANGSGGDVAPTLAGGAAAAAGVPVPHTAAPGNIDISADTNFAGPTGGGAEPMSQFFSKNQNWAPPSLAQAAAGYGSAAQRKRQALY